MNKNKIGKYLQFDRTPCMGLVSYQGKYVFRVLAEQLGALEP